MLEQEAPPTPPAVPPLRGRSTDSLADHGSQVRPSWRRRAWQWAVSGRGIAAALLLAVAGAAAWGARAERFVVREVALAGNQLVAAPALARLAGVEGQPIWSVDPRAVAARLQAHPYVIGADVALRLPNHVQITIREPRQALGWLSQAQRYAIAPDGRLSPLSAQAPLSPTLAIHDWRSSPAQAGDRVPPAVVELAQMLLVRFPAETSLPIRGLAWDPLHGLVLAAGDDRVIFWGDDTRLDARLELVAALGRQQIAYRVLDLRGRIAAYRNEPDSSLPIFSFIPSRRES